MDNNIFLSLIQTSIYRAWGRRDLQPSPLHAWLAQDRLRKQTEKVRWIRL